MYAQARASSPNGTYACEIEQTFTDGNGTVVVVHRQTAERNGKRLDNRQALIFKIVDGKIVDTARHERRHRDRRRVLPVAPRRAGWIRAPSGARSIFRDADGLLRALLHGLLDTGPEVVGRVLLQHVEEVVVTHFEHLREPRPCNWRCSRRDRSRRRPSSPRRLLGSRLPLWYGRPNAGGTLAHIHDRVRDRLRTSPDQGTLPRKGRKQSRMSSTRRSPTSMAAKCPPRGISDQWTMS